MPASSVHLAPCAGKPASNNAAPACGEPEIVRRAADKRRARINGDADRIFVSPSGVSPAIRRIAPPAVAGSEGSRGRLTMVPAAAKQRGSGAGGAYVLAKGRAGRGASRRLIKAKHRNLSAKYSVIAHHAKKTS